MCWVTVLEVAIRDSSSTQAAHTESASGVYLFIQQMFIAYLLWARPRFFKKLIN